MIELCFAVGLIVLAYFIGSSIEKKHFKSLRLREAKLNKMSWHNLGKKKHHKNVDESKLFTGHVVIAQDHFKSFIAGLISLVGGRMSVYESLLDRGRREALCRLREKAARWGADELIHVRFETSTLGVNQGKQKSGVIEVLAYGTALKRSNV